MVNKATIDLIKRFEGFRSNAYKCPAGVWTIGYGNTFYANGAKVKEGDVIAENDAEILLLKIVIDFSNRLVGLVPWYLNDRQFGALVSFAYNCGVEALSKSTLLKKVKANPNDPSIANEFAKWNKAGGKVLPGLVKRREAESKLYFS